MPIYEYQCQSCGHELEKLQRMNDTPMTDCPDCGEDTLSRLVSAAGFRLKGSGWYETDFKKGGKKNLHDSAHGKASAKKDSTDSAPSAKPVTPKPAAGKPAASSSDAA